ncbi:MAG: hypothetical protein HQK79_18130 [Desulfobacterales bacterium]|nr:hypothetical protein [Desulfobacterales bacterium]
MDNRAIIKYEPQFSFTNSMQTYIKILLKYALLLLVIILLNYDLSFSDDSPSIDDKEVQNIATDYVMSVFKKYLNNKDLKLSDITVSTDRGQSEKLKCSVSNIDGRFSSLRMDKRTLNGRFNLSIAIEKSSGISNCIPFMSQYTANKAKSSKIECFIDDELSDELSHALIKDRIKKLYGNPLDIKITKTDITNYASNGPRSEMDITAVFDDKIRNIRITFEAKPDDVKEYSELILKSRQWYLSNEVVTLDVDIPSDNFLRKSLKPFLLAYIKNEIEKASGKPWGLVEFFSSVNDILKKKVIKGSNMRILLYIECKFELEKIIGDCEYTCKVNAGYMYNSSTNEWNLIKDELKVIDYQIIK